MADRKPQADRHAEHPLPFRPPLALRARLTAYKERTGQKVNAILTRALTEFLDKHDPDSKPETTKES